MAGITFSEQEVKKLILALAGSKAMPDEPEEKMDDSEEKPEESEKSEEKGEGKPFDEESTKDMLVRKMKEKGSK
jgi:hypothetical protein